MRLESYVAGAWRSGTGRAAVLRDASTGDVVAEAGARVSISAPRSVTPATPVARCCAP